MKWVAIKEVIMNHGVGESDQLVRTAEHWDSAKCDREQLTRDGGQCDAEQRDSEKWWCVK